MVRLWLYCVLLMVPFSLVPHIQVEMTATSLQNWDVILSGPAELYLK